MPAGGGAVQHIANALLALCARLFVPTGQTRPLRPWHHQGHKWFGMEHPPSTLLAWGLLSPRFGYAFASGMEPWQGMSLIGCW
jgi:hypothetical protein